MKGKPAKKTYTQQKPWFSSRLPFKLLSNTTPPALRSRLWRKVSARFCSTRDPPRRYAVPYKQRRRVYRAQTCHGRCLPETLRKPASWIVAVCEQSEYKGVWGEGLPKSAKISLLLGGKGVFRERFSGSCTMRQKGDGRVSIPPRSAFWGAFWGAWQRSRCLREGGRSASTDRKGKGKGAFCHCCRCWWRKDKSRPARGSLSGTVMSDGKVFV